MYDVQWSPIHPALFAAVDGTGRLDLWNLNNDTEVQIWTIFRLNARETHVLLSPNLPHCTPLQVPTASTHSESMTSLNRLRWTHSGHQIAVGDDDGHVFIYDVGEVGELLQRMLILIKPGSHMRLKVHCNEYGPVFGIIHKMNCSPCISTVHVFLVLTK